MKPVKSFVRRQLLPQRRREPGSKLIVVAGMFSTGNGLARAAVGCFRRLKRAGLNVVAVDVSGILNQVDCEPDVQVGPLPEGRDHTVLLFVNAPETETVIWKLGLRRWQGCRIIGNWAWELPVPPPDWGRHSRFLSEIWVPSRFVARSVAGIVDIPVRVIPHALEISDHILQASQYYTSDVFRVLVSGDARSSLERKNVIGAIRIFKAAFHDVAKARLTLKCRNLSEFEGDARRIHDEIGGDPRIEVMDRTLDTSANRYLIAGSDAILSPHRSEGFGLVMAEAMMLGKPVLATGWSGNLDYMSPSTAILLPYELRPVNDPARIYLGRDGAVWAHVNEAEAASSLRKLFDQPRLGSHIGNSARRSVQESLTGDDYLRSLHLVDAIESRDRIGH